MSSESSATSQNLEAVEGVLTSRQLTKSQGAVRLLRFLYEEELAGRGFSLREDSIARALYGRGHDFDPQLDSIVRVNMARLRAKLDDYRFAHRTGRWLIDVPASQYRITVVANPDFQPEPAPAAAVEPVAETAPPHSSTVPPLPQRRFAGWVWPALVIGIVLGIATASSLWRVWQGTDSRPAFQASVRPFSRAGGMEQFPTFSADGKTVIFAWNQVPLKRASLYTQAIDSQVPVPLPGSQVGDTRPSFSPDGKKLAYVRELALQGEKQIVVRDLSNGVEAIVGTLNGYAPWVCRLPRLSWSPDSARLYTVAASVVAPGQTPDAETKRCSVLAMDTTNRHATFLTHSEGTSLGDLEAQVSPDGTQIAFLRREAYASDVVYVMPATGGTPCRVLATPKNLNGFTWSADGKHLVLAEVTRSGGSFLQYLELRTGRVTTIDKLEDDFGYPTLSRDGQTLVVTTYQVHEAISLIDDTGDRELVSDQNRNYNGVISPDGRMLVFASERGGSANLWLKDITKQSVSTPLLNTPSQTTNWPAWFPDNKSLLFTCKNGAYTQICRVSLDTKNIVPLTSGNYENTLPSLSHDATSFYFSSNRTGKYELYRQSLLSSKVEQLTHGGVLSGYESKDGSSLYIVTDKQGPGFLIAPVDAHSIVTDPSLPESRKYVRPQLQVLGPEHPWCAARGGIAYADFKGDHTEIMLYNPASGATQRIFTIPQKRAVELLRESERDGFVYSLQADRTGELRLYSK